MANTEGIEAFCVGRADLTCCVARRWLLSAVRRVHERKFLPMSIVDQCDAAMFAAYFVLLCVVLAGLRTMEKSDAKLCDEFLQASAGGISRFWIEKGGGKRRNSIFFLRNRSCSPGL